MGGIFSSSSLSFLFVKNDEETWFCLIMKSEKTSHMALKYSQSLRIFANMVFFLLGFLGWVSSCCVGGTPTDLSIWVKLIPRQMVGNTKSQMSKEKLKQTKQQQFKNGILRFCRESLEEMIYIIPSDVKKSLPLNFLLSAKNLLLIVNYISNLIFSERQSCS